MTLYINIGWLNRKRILKLIDLGVRHFMVVDRNTLLYLIRLKNKYNLDIICDNGAFRGRVNLKLIQLAREYHVKYILPDSLEDSWNTIRLHLKYKDLYDPELSYVVIQGKNITDYLMCYFAMRKYFNIKRLAIGGLLLKQSKKEREEIVKRIRRLFNGKIHVLGYISKYADTCDISLKMFGRYHGREGNILERFLFC